MIDWALMASLVSNAVALFAFWHFLRHCRAMREEAQQRRKGDFVAEEEKFSTQRNVTYVLLAVFVGMSLSVLIGSDQSERSIVLQAIINITTFAVGYWLGASKQSQDQIQAAIRRDDVKTLITDNKKVDNINVDTNNVNIHENPEK